MPLIRSSWISFDYAVVPVIL